MVCHATSESNTSEVQAPQEPRLSWRHWSLPTTTPRAPTPALATPTGQLTLLSEAAALVPTAAANTVTVVMLAKPSAAAAAAKATKAAENAGTATVVAAPSLAVVCRTGSPATVVAIAVMVPVAVAPRAAYTAPCVVTTVVPALAITVVPSAALSRTGCEERRKGEKRGNE